MRGRDLPMFCTVCGHPVDPTAQFCTNCGTKVPVSTGDAPPAPALPPRSSDLTRLPHLVMVWDKFSLVMNFQFQDPYGRPLGGTQGELAFPVKYTLFDETGQAVLMVDAQRVRGLHFEFVIHDASGAALASLHVESSVLSRRYGLSVGGQENWALTTDAMGYHYQVEEVASGRALATAERRPAVRTSTTEISIADGQPLDHRIILGAMILAGYFTLRG